MASIAHENLKSRLEDIDQLLEAHSALTKLKKAHAAAAAGGGLAGIKDVVDALVEQPGKGRPAEVAALNRAAFVLLTAHFQGFVQDLHEEAGRHVLNGKVGDVDATLKSLVPRNSNPHVDIIERMFAGIGCYEVMATISWPRSANATVKRRLGEYITTRNKIAHGQKIKVTKAQVTLYKEYVERLAAKLVGIVSRKVRDATGTAPW